METQYWIQIGISVLTVGMSAFVAHTVAHKRIRHEKEESKRSRNFEIQKIYWEKQMHVLAESFHYARSLNELIGHLPSISDEDSRAVKKLLEAKEFWDRNRFFLPETLRGPAIGIVNSVSATYTGSEKFLEIAEGMVTEMLSEINAAIVAFSKKFDLDLSSQEGK